jgi:hypothetical protein
MKDGKTEGEENKDKTEAGNGEGGTLSMASTEISPEKGGN